MMASAPHQGRSVVLSFMKSLEDLLHAAEQSFSNRSGIWGVVIRRVEPLLRLLHHLQLHFPSFLSLMTQWHIPRLLNSAVTRTSVTHARVIKSVLQQRVSKYC